MKLAALLTLGLSFLLFPTAPSQAGTFDRSHAIFFPPELKDSIGAQQEFPLFWWNFAVLEPRAADGTEDWAGAERLCAALKNAGSALVRRAECGQSVSELGPLLGQWARDYPLRAPFPGVPAIKRKMAATLAKASLPSGDASLLSILQSDPLEGWLELKTRAEKRISVKLPRNRGFFADPETRRIVVPVQLAFPPGETRKTLELREKTAGAVWILIGPHGSTLSNEAQVALDLKSVSWVGSLLLLLFAAFLAASKRWRLLLIVPPVLVAIGVAVLSVILLQGSIHGLTLALGTGIIGLALDYGLHAALDGDQARVWKSNLMGLLTTIVGLLVLMSSSVPLLRQMMLFACIGLVTAWLLLFILFMAIPERLVSHPLPLRFYASKPAAVAIGLIFGFALLGVVAVRPNFEIQQFDYQDSPTRATSRWLFKTLNLRSPLFSINAGEGAHDASHAEKTWADSQGITLETVSGYLPPLALQQKNIATWAPACHLSERTFTALEQKFFAPFLSTSLCPTVVATALTDPELTHTRSYLAHLGSGNRWISLWLPSSDDQERAIRERFPAAVSLKEMVMTFPRTLARELSWMGPLALLLAGGSLGLYYRNRRLVLAALIPFFTGLGLVALAVFALGLETSFISIVALIIVFGFSIDYGIFATDLGLRAQGWKPDGVWTAITFAAIATVSGFVPLLFCRHPVLAHLGQTLFLGAVGTYLGTIWGIPYLMHPRPKP